MLGRVRGGGGYLLDLFVKEVANLSFRPHHHLIGCAGERGERCEKDERR